jgi:hypothetical protein
MDFEKIDSIRQNTDTSFRADLTSACGALKTFQLKRLNPFWLKLTGFFVLGIL